MEQRGKRAGVNHELGGRAVDRAIDIKIEPVTHANRHAAETAMLHSGCAAGSVRIDFQNQQLPLAIEDRSGGKKNISTKDSIDLLLVEHAGSTAGTAKIDNHDRFIQEFERAKLEPARNGNFELPGIPVSPKYSRRCAAIALTGAPVSTPSQAGLPLMIARTRR